jgi:hypothetical protein
VSWTNQNYQIDRELHLDAEHRLPKILSGCAHPVRRRRCVDVGIGLARTRIAHATDLPGHRAATLAGSQLDEQQATALAMLVDSDDRVGRQAGSQAMTLAADEAAALMPRPAP